MNYQGMVWGQQSQTYFFFTFPLLAQGSNMEL